MMDGVIPQRYDSLPFPRSRGLRLENLVLCRQLAVLRLAARTFPKAQQDSGRLVYSRSKLRTFLLQVKQNIIC
jgi:hypothetical protein